MIFKQLKQDLFSVDESYYLVHCISADFALGAGIAKEFNKRFNTRQKLFTIYPNFLKEYHNHNQSGICLPVEHTLNLVTKERYYQKPSYVSLTVALFRLRDFCIKNDIKKIAMPKIGCGLDRLSWYEVKPIIISIFKDTDIEILVCEK
jgi:O-acetyl-ADP-ribose deacetylase (regulator of RNase III)